MCMRAKEGAFEDVTVTKRPRSALSPPYAALAALSLPYWRRRLPRDVHSIRNHSHGTACVASTYDNDNAAIAECMHTVDLTPTIRTVTP